MSHAPVIGSLLPINDVDRRLDGLDALRGIAAIGVCLFHWEQIVFAVPAESQTFRLGLLGVELFFMISGAVILLVADRNPKPRTFIVARAVRLYEIIHPQELTIVDQLKAYCEASDLIFAEGSSLHLYAFVARSDQRVFVVRRRKMSLVFDWQVTSFGGPRLSGTPHISAAFSPANDPSHARLKVALNLGSLHDELRSFGLVSGQRWPTPPRESVVEEIADVMKKLGETFVERPLPT